jgi:hypothetical protein
MPFPMELSPFIARKAPSSATNHPIAQIAIICPLIAIFTNGNDRQSIIINTAF